ncbi:MAG TPA: hypothetical protein VGR27_07245 [Longimicrobiaceae bacterium]|nr:hypothetical protein [Longimicrobiaceae bacterium]
MKVPIPVEPVTSHARLSRSGEPNQALLRLHREAPQLRVGVLPQLDDPGVVLDGPPSIPEPLVIDTVMVPMTRMNPNVLSFRVAMHAWGANSSDILFISDYPNWAAIDAACQPCEQWFQAQQPREGTPERARWDAMGAALQRAYAGHSDEIYAAPMGRAKQ